MLCIVVHRVFSVPPQLRNATVRWIPLFCAPPCFWSCYFGRVADEEVRDITMGFDVTTGQAILNVRIQIHPSIRPSFGIILGELVGQ